MLKNFSMLSIAKGNGVRPVRPIHRFLSIRSTVMSYSKKHRDEQALNVFGEVLSKRQMEEKPLIEKIAFKKQIEEKSIKQGQFSKKQRGEKPFAIKIKSFVPKPNAEKFLLNYECFENKRRDEESVDIMERIFSKKQQEDKPVDVYGEVISEKPNEEKPFAENKKYGKNLIKEKPELSKISCKKHKEQKPYSVEIKSFIRKPTNELTSFAFESLSDDENPIAEDIVGCIRKPTSKKLREEKQCLNVSSQKQQEDPFIDEISNFIRKPSADISCKKLQEEKTHLSGESFKKQKYDQPRSQIKSFIRKPTGFIRKPISERFGKKRQEKKSRLSNVSCNNHTQEKAYTVDTQSLLKPTVESFDKKQQEEDAVIDNISCKKHEMVCKNQKDKKDKKRTEVFEK